jgi:hypothetical protein
LKEIGIQLRLCHGCRQEKPAKHQPDHAAGEGVYISSDVLWLSIETWIAQCEDERLLDEQRQEQPCRKAHDK